MASANPDYVYEEPKRKRRSGFNESVPPGSRAKCNSCGAVDSVKIKYSESHLKGPGRKLKVCGGCGGKLSMRRSPKAPNVVSYVVVRQLNGVPFGDIPCIDQFTAERTALTFCERGPVARSRVAAVVELLDNERTGNVRVLRYDNFRQRHQSLVWSKGCETCRGKGLIAHTMQPRPVVGATGSTVVPTSGMRDKTTIKYVACSECNGLGGELTRRVLFGRELKAEFPLWSAKR